MKKSKLHTKQLKKKYGQRWTVKGVDLEISQGEIVGLLGPNGAGKTTTFYMVVGLIRPNHGKIFIDDKDITRMPMYKRARLGIGYLPQESSVFRKLSVEDNIKGILEMATSLSRKEIKERTEQLLEEFGITHVRKTWVCTYQEAKGVEQK